MRVLGVAADRYTYNMLLRAEVVAGGGELTDGLLSTARAMRDSGVHVDQHLYSTLISMHARNGNADEALKLLGRAASEGVDLDAAAYHAVMGGFAERGDVRRTVRYPTYCPFVVRFVWYTPRHTWNPCAISLRARQCNGKVGS
jgi:pentatricopeptide repeat protein